MARPRSEFREEGFLPEHTERNAYKYQVSRYEFAARYVRGKEVLDVATGTGYGADVLMRIGEATSVTGVDRSDEAIAYAVSHYGAAGSDFIVGDALRLPFLDDRFDVVVSIETLEHIVDQQSFLDELARVLREDGTLILSTPNKKYDPRNKFHVAPLATVEFLKILRPRFLDVQTFGQDHMSRPARYIARANRMAGFVIPGSVLGALYWAKTKVARIVDSQIIRTDDPSGHRNVIAVCRDKRNRRDGAGVPL